MPRQPPMKKYTGDDEVSFSQWLLQFEASWEHLVSQTISAENVQYEDLNNDLIERFTVEDYKRKLETKLRNSKYAKGMNTS